MSNELQLSIIKDEHDLNETYMLIYIYLYMDNIVGDVKMTASAPNNSFQLWKSVNFGFSLSSIISSFFIRITWSLLLFTRWFFDIVYLFIDSSYC